MGLLDGLRVRRNHEAISAAFTGTVDPSTYPIATPWGSSDLQRIVFEDIFGSDVPLNTREAAMRIPAVARGRNLIVSSIGRMPLVAMRAGEPLPPLEQPTWLYRTDDGTTPQHKLVWTVDDLIFYGWSCHWRTNAADTGRPLTTRRINQGDWSIDADNRVHVDGQPATNDSNGHPQVLLIPGFHEGILTFGHDALDDARELYATVRERIRNPKAHLDLHQEDGDPLTDDQIDALIDRWEAARRKRRGGVAYTSKHIVARELGGGGEQLLIEERNAASLDLARVIGVTAALIDATAPKASLNYETTTGRNLEFVDRDLRLYMEPIASRLSLDDCVPRGVHVGFDLKDFTAPVPAPTGPELQD